MSFYLLFSIALFLDILFGDPRFLPHPVKGIGFLCTTTERICRKYIRDVKLAGSLAFTLVLLCTVSIPACLLLLCHLFFPALEMVVAVFLIYTAIACRDLQSHSKEVYTALTTSDQLSPAREAVSRIVGRDTSNLDSQGICRACVETVAENLVDGITAPIFFAIVFSFFPTSSFFLPISMAALGAYGYKAINTMDSMYGYKNETYINFGKTAARVDDLMNYIPARLTGLILVAAVWFLGKDGRGAMKIFLRDRLQHASPNGGHPEAAVAGGLGVQLGGGSSYFGQTVVKPTIGDSTRALEPSDILTTNRLMFIGTILFIALMFSIRFSLLGA